nr:T9SS type A sorting domain-containing protein [Bacteroidia bacterium]
TYRAKAQYDLNYGAPNDYAVVKEPLIYWDLVRDQFPPILIQADMGGSMDYISINKLIQNKDELGKFKQLEVWEYKTNEQKWILLNKHINNRNYNNNQIIANTKESWQLINNSLPPNYQKTVISNQFINSNIIGQTNTYFNEAGALERTENNEFIYLNNKRVIDTLTIENYKTVTKYTYDANDNCIKMDVNNITTGTPINHLVYGYEGNLLTKISSIRNADTIYSNQYIYKNGLLSEVIKSYNINDNFNEIEWYKHGYTADGKLNWACMYSKANDVWAKNDSMYFNYTNNQVDTSFGYGANNDAWEDVPLFRFIFDANLVGLQPTLNNNLSFNVYPNPVGKLLNIEADYDITSIKIINILGKTVYEQPFPSSQIKLNNFKPGVYFLSIESSRGRGQKKIIID